MKVLITGGAGFIGSHITDACIAAGHEVAVVDDLSSGKRELVNPAARFYEADIRQATLEDVFKEARPEVVIHQAARANVRESMQRPMLYADVNILGSLNLLECCRKWSSRKLIYASTGGAVYGEPQTLPVPEDHPINPLDPYGASKHHVEHYLYLYKANYGLDYTVLRYPNVYGPRQDPFGEAGVVAIFTQKLLNGEQPIINGTGEQRRDFVHVSDVARANLLAMERGSGGIYNIGSGIGTSVNEIYDVLAAATESGLPRKHGPEKRGEVFQVYLDASRAAADLEWSPTVDLRSGLASTVRYFRENCFPASLTAGSPVRGIG